MKGCQTGHKLIVIGNIFKRHLSNACCGIAIVHAGTLQQKGPGCRCLWVQQLNQLLIVASIACYRFIDASLSHPCVRAVNSKLSHRERNTAVNRRGHGR